LVIYARHGVLPEEKTLGQQFLVSLALYLDLKPAGTLDDLGLTVNYAAVCHDVESIFMRHTYDLIETCAEKTARHLLLNYPALKGVKVCVKKPWAPVGLPLAYAAVEIERFWHTAYIALGANIGDRTAYINAALKAMDSDATKVLKHSSFYETKPVSPVPQGDYINAAAALKTLLSPRELMAFLLKIENELGRERTVHWGPRTVDLDILLYDDVVSDDDVILLPHPRMQSRLFVLAPLSEIAPNAVHPLLRQRIADLAAQLSENAESR
jgi:dihydroneopterin aldolase/2-amino-4-hydroxy-6-hydroxymethyldihydropteridine diphosphokinase